MISWASDARGVPWTTNSRPQITPDPSNLIHGSTFHKVVFGLKVLCGWYAIPWGALYRLSDNSSRVPSWYWGRSAKRPNMQFDKELFGYQDYPGISEWGDGRLGQTRAEGDRYYDELILCRISDVIWLKVPRPIFELKITWIHIVKYFELIALSFDAGTFGTLTDAGGGFFLMPVLLVLCALILYLPDKISLPSGRQSLRCLLERDDSWQYKANAGHIQLICFLKV